MKEQLRRERGRRGDLDRPEGHYANYFQIGHNEFEFLLEFGRQERKINTRIYVSLPRAQMFYELLATTLAEHTRMFGEPLFACKTSKSA